jgi:hypothetical protein
VCLGYRPWGYPAGGFAMNWMGWFLLTLVAIVLLIRAIARKDKNAGLE